MSASFVAVGIFPAPAYELAGIWGALIFREDLQG